MHTPVFLNEVLEVFDPQPGQIYADATVNGGGHSRALAERVGDRGRVVGIDLDQEILHRLQIRNEQEGRKNIELLHGNYANLESILDAHGYEHVDGVLFDLGFSSYHVDESRRGFSFLRDEPLDMRYDPTRNDLTAEKIINTWSEPAIADLIRACGEERYGKRIAARIITERKKKRIVGSAELAEIIRRSIPRRSLTRIHPATRTFQALRMAVNDELGNIERGMTAAVKKLHIGGKLIAISFHSIEDRAVKQALKKLQMERMIEPIMRKPIKPSIKEVRINPRARSAKMRAARKIV